MLEGVSCVRPQGAMYLFPSITLPDAAVKAAKRQWRPTPSGARCSRARGLVTVPGSGRGQKNGTWHFRTTFLPAEADRQRVQHPGFQGRVPRPSTAAAASR